MVFLFSWETLNIIVGAWYCCDDIHIIKYIHDGIPSNTEPPYFFTSPVLQRVGDDKKETPLEVVILQAEEGGGLSLVGDGRHSPTLFAVRSLVLSDTSN